MKTKKELKKDKIKKELKKDKERKERNKKYKTLIKSCLKKHHLIKEEQQFSKEIEKLQSFLDKALIKGIIHKNKANRLKSLFFKKRNNLIKKDQIIS